MTTLRLVPDHAGGFRLLDEKHGAAITGTDIKLSEDILPAAEGGVGSDWMYTNVILSGTGMPRPQSASRVHRFTGSSVIDGSLFPKDTLVASVGEDGADMRGAADFQVYSNREGTVVVKFQATKLLAADGTHSTIDTGIITSGATAMTEAAPGIWSMAAPVFDPVADDGTFEVVSDGLIVSGTGLFSVLVTFAFTEIEE